MEQWRHPFVDRQNEGIEVSACRMNLLDMRGLLPQKVGKKTMATRKTCPLAYPNFWKLHRYVVSDADFILILGYS